MPARGSATLLEDGGRTCLRFERVLAHPREKVWRALTAASELAAWHPSPFEFEPRVGGRVTFNSELGGPEMPEGEVREYDPPTALAYTWGEDLLRWELAEHPDGCVLVLTHAFDDRFKAARDAAGWDLCLEALPAALEGHAPAEAARPRAIPEGWRELNAGYERRFGIAPERATPPPAMD